MFSTLAVKIVEFRKAIISNSFNRPSTDRTNAPQTSIAYIKSEQDTDVVDKYKPQAQHTQNLRHSPEAGAQQETSNREAAHRNRSWYAAKESVFDANLGGQLGQCGLCVIRLR